MVLIFSGRGPQEGKLKLMKDDRFSVLLAVWNIFPKSLGASTNLIY